jgi:endogenous inhibitor of DNA gyrase (YacG/DUF329 family)
MNQKLPCAVCGNFTRRLLFKNKKISIPVCSKKCEHLYLKNLSQNTEEHTLILRYLDGRIKVYRTRNRIGWGVTGVAVALLLLGALLPEVNLFIVGVLVASASAVATRHYEDRIKKLTIQRKRRAI